MKSAPNQAKWFPETGVNAMVDQTWEFNVAISGVALNARIFLSVFCVTSVSISGIRARLSTGVIITISKSYIVHVFTKRYSRR